jgi:hypothetical protein
MASKVTGLKLAWFVFRYFLIGKFHCDIPQSYKKFFKIGFYTLWFLIASSVGYSIQQFLIYLKGILI